MEADLTKASKLFCEGMSLLEFMSSGFSSDRIEVSVGNSFFNNCYSTINSKLQNSADKAS